MRTVYAYSAYGEVAVLGPDGGNSLQFTGRENDGTGLYHYRARYYDSFLKRFIREDPIGIAAGTNLYAYVRGAPITFNDPLGLDWFRPGGASHIVGREGIPGFSPGDPAMVFIENWVPGGYDMGVLHDHFVDEKVSAGWPDWLVNAPTIQYFYWRSVATSAFSSMDEIAKRFQSQSAVPSRPNCR